MSEHDVLTSAATVVASLFGMITLLLGWLGNKIYDKLTEMSDTMHRVESDLHGRITDLDRRVTVVETKCTMPHATGIKRANN
jgi:predicted PurR-regulated permease PerM